MDMDTDDHFHYIFSCTPYNIPYILHPPFKCFVMLIILKQENTIYET